MKKRALSLLEIIIAIFIITLITGAIGYNMKGALDRGKAFRTEQAIAELHDLLLMSLSLRESADVTGAMIASNPVHYLDGLGMAKNPAKLVVDGWGKNLTIKYDKEEDDFLISSNNLDAYYAKKGKVVLPNPVKG